MVIQVVATSKEIETRGITVNGMAIKGPEISGATTRGGITTDRVTTSRLATVRVTTSGGVIKTLASQESAIIVDRKDIGGMSVPGKVMGKDGVQRHKGRMKAGQAKDGQILLELHPRETLISCC